MKNEPAGDRDSEAGAKLRSGDSDRESGGANQNLLETKGSDANKIEAESN